MAEDHGVGVGFLWKPVVLGLLTVLVMVPFFRWVRGTSKPPPVASVPGSQQAPVQDLAQNGNDRLGVFGANSKFASVVGKQGDSLSTRARVMNVFRMKKALVAVTDASVFIHATFDDDLPEWVRPGKTVQLDGRITEVKTKTNVHVSGGKLTAVL